MLAAALAYTLSLEKGLEAMKVEDRGVTCAHAVAKHATALGIFQPEDHIVKGMVKHVHLSSIYKAGTMSKIDYIVQLHYLLLSLEHCWRRVNLTYTF